MLKVHEPGEPRVLIEAVVWFPIYFLLKIQKFWPKKTHTKLRVSFNINGHQILFKACSNLVTTDACPPHNNLHPFVDYIFTCILLYKLNCYTSSQL